MTPPKFISIVVEGWYLQRHNILICRKWNGNRPQDHIVYYMLFGKSRFTIIFMSTLVLNISLPKRTSIYSFTIWTKTMKSYIEFSTYTMYNIHSWKHPHKGNKRFSNHRWQNLLLNELCYFVLFSKNRRKVSHKKLWQNSNFSVIIYLFLLFAPRATICFFSLIHSNLLITLQIQYITVSKSKQIVPK